jgi:hypothetical protein
MKILYLHGYKAKPNFERIGYLESLGHEVVAPHINYERESDILLRLLEDDYDMVVGSSLGGYMGFHISDYKSIPCVCFNPPLARDLMVYIQTPEDWDYDSIIPQTKDIVLGGSDEVVNPYETLEWLMGNRPHVNIHFYDNMSHTIKIEEFEEVMNMVLGRYY